MSQQNSSLDVSPDKGECLQPQSSSIPSSAIEATSSSLQHENQNVIQTVPLNTNATIQERELVRFETGNPDTDATFSGTLELGPVTGTSSIIVVESVPGLMTSADFCVFVRPFADTIRHFRPLRLTSERNRYIVVILFTASSEAQNFAQVFKGKHYLRGLVQETCSVRDVISVRFDRSNAASSSSVETASTIHDSNKEPNTANDFFSTTLFPHGALFPAENSDPSSASCAVCLEKVFGQTAALVTTFCNHSMHTACLAQWDRNDCPVCRHTHELTPEASSCMNCETRNDLWMCVVCGYVGCDVYTNKHAQAHFKETQHPFAMNLEECTFWSGDKLRAGSVWDYISERFVNRLLTSDDGKIVEVSAEPRGTAASASDINTSTEACCSSRPEVDDDDDENNDRAFQAAIYASRMDAVVDDYRGQMERMQAEHTSEQHNLTTRLQKLERQVSDLTKERKSLNRKVADMDKELKVVKDKNGFLKSLNETLLHDKKGWNEEVEKMKVKLKQAEESKQGLEEQLRDLMMHLETQAKITGSSDSCRSDASELHGGDVLSVGPSPRKRLSMKTNRRCSSGN